jgi:hypothetical protein
MAEDLNIHENRYDGPETRSRNRIYTKNDKNFLLVFNEHQNVQTHTFIKLLSVA